MHLMPSEAFLAASTWNERQSAPEMQSEMALRLLTFTSYNVIFFLNACLGTLGVCAS